MEEKLKAIREAMAELEKRNKHRIRKNNTIMFYTGDIERESDKAYLVHIDNTEWKVWLAKRYVKADLFHGIYEATIKDFDYTIFKIVESKYSKYGDRVERSVKGEKLYEIFISGDDDDEYERLSDLEFLLNY